MGDDEDSKDTEAWRAKHPNALFTLYLDVEDMPQGVLFNTTLYADDPGVTSGFAGSNQFRALEEVEAWLIGQRIETCELAFSVYKLDRARLILPCASRAREIHLHIFGPHSSWALAQFLQAVHDHAPGGVVYIGLHDLDECLRSREVMDVLTQFTRVECMTMQLEYGRRHMNRAGQDAIVQALPRFPLLRNFSFHGHVEKSTLELLYAQIPRCPRLGYVRGGHRDQVEMDRRLQVLGRYNTFLPVRTLLVLLLPYSLASRMPNTPYLIKEHVRLLFPYLISTDLSEW